MFLQERFGTLAGRDDWARWTERLASLKVDGVAVGMSPRMARPGVASLADAARAAPDFVLVRTTRRSVREFLASPEGEPLRGAALAPEQCRLIVGGVAVGMSQPCVLVYDETLQVRFRWELG